MKLSIDSHIKNNHLHKSHKKWNLNRFHNKVLNYNLGTDLSIHNSLVGNYPNRCYQLSVDIYLLGNLCMY